MIVKQISAEETISVRHSVLWPNEPVRYCRLSEDDVGVHFGVEVQGRLVCVASVFVDGDSARLRKFATLAAYQGQGIGSKVVKHIISWLKQASISYFWLDARESAMAFYVRLGFSPEGERFYKNTMPYCKMSMSF